MGRSKIQYRHQAFTMVEILSAIAIIALLVAVMVPAIGNYVETARKTADKQTLMVLNDALNRYKTQGGDLTALTSGASIGNVLTKLQTAVTWCGMRHQFLRKGETYNLSDLGAIGEGRRYRFTKYGDYADGSAVGSNILETVADAGFDVGDEAAFDSWITDAMAQTGSSNYLALTNPDTTSLFGIYLKVASNGDKVRIWWGDGTTSNYDGISTDSSSAIAKDYGSAANRAIVIVGDVSYIYSANDETLGGAGATYWGGDVSTMKSLTHINISGNSTIGGDVTNMTNLTYLAAANGNSISGDITNLTNLVYLSLWDGTSITGDVTGLTQLKGLRAYGTNTLSGDVTGMPALTQLIVQGSNTVTGNISAMTGLTTLSIGGNNTITGDVTGFPLEYIDLVGFSSVDVTSLISVSASATALTSFILANNNYPLTQTQVDTVLDNIWTNRDASKFRLERHIKMTDSSQAVPSAAGETTKANLQAYHSPNDDSQYRVWTVETN